MFTLRRMPSLLLAIALLASSAVVTDSPAEVVDIVVRSQDSLRKLDKTVSDDY